MKRVKRMSRIAAATIVSLVLFPTFAAAATNVSTQTNQLLPTGGNSCTQILVTSVTPYVYGNSVNAFDVVIPDASYVAIGGHVGTSLIPLRYISRAFTPDGQLRIHVDTDAVAVGRGVAISLTMLSAKDGIVCAATISFATDTNGSIIPMSSVPVRVGESVAPHTQPTNSYTAPAIKPAVKPVSTIPAATSSVPLATEQSAVCKTFSGALQLWLILLALYLVIVAVTALMQPPLAEKNPAIPVALILVPLILLVGFWYFAPTCRFASWVPIVLLIIAIVGLLVAFREQPGKKGKQLLLPLNNTKPAMPMPAAKTPTPAPKQTLPSQPVTSSDQQKPGSPMPSQISAPTQTLLSPQTPSRLAHPMQPGGQSSLQRK